MDNDANSIRPLPNHLLQVQLMSGKQGIFDIKPHLHLDSLSGLRDPVYFSRASILFGAVTWPDSEDIAPETMAAELTALETA